MNVSRETLAYCACGNTARKGQRNCSHCHAKAQREFRARRKETSEKLHRKLARVGIIVKKLEQQLG